MKHTTDRDRRAIEHMQGELERLTGSHKPGDFHARCHVGYTDHDDHGDREVAWKHHTPALFDDPLAFVEHMRTEHRRTKPYRMYDNLSQNDYRRTAPPIAYDTDMPLRPTHQRPPKQRPLDMIKDPFAPGRTVEFIDYTDDGTRLHRPAQVWSLAVKERTRSPETLYVVPLDGPMSRRALRVEHVHPDHHTNPTGHRCLFRIIDHAQHSGYAREDYEFAAYTP